MNLGNKGAVELFCGYTCVITLVPFLRLSFTQETHKKAIFKAVTLNEIGAI